jgi:DNA-directed RNA polymerase specialized sigma24 family protein
MRPSELSALLHRAAFIPSAHATRVPELRAELYDVALAAAGVAAAKYLSEQPDGEKLVPYTGKSAHRAVWRELRRRKREDGIKVLDSQGAVPQPPCPKKGPQPSLVPHALMTYVDEEGILDRLSLPDVQSHLAVLTPPERQAITARFGLGSEGRLTEEATAAMMDLTGRRVRQLVSAGLQRMRNTAAPPADGAASAA